jgi:hypothetical protein
LAQLSSKTPVKLAQLSSNKICQIGPTFIQKNCLAVDFIVTEVAFARVTRSGEFSTLRSFFENCSLPTFFDLRTFLRRRRYVLILANPGLGYILGDFFTNSSGHTASGSLPEPEISIFK